MAHFLRLIFSLILILFIQTGTSLAQVGWTKAYDNAVVVAAEERAAEVGNEILKQGGNAVDAAVAAFADVEKHVDNVAFAAVDALVVVEMKSTQLIVGYAAAFVVALVESVVRVVVVVAAAAAAAVVVVVDAAAAADLL